MLIADTGAVYAFYDANDQYHEGVRKIVLQQSGNIIIPDLILVEIDYLLGKFLGIDAELDFCKMSSMVCIVCTVWMRLLCKIAAV